MPLRSRGALHKGQVAFITTLFWVPYLLQFLAGLAAVPLCLLFSLEQFALSFGCCGMPDFAFVL